MMLRNALLAATILAVPVAAIAAQPVSGPYIAAGVGVSGMQDQSVNGLNYGGVNLSSGGNLQTDPGLFTSGAVGYGFGNGLRVELQGDWRDNKLTNAGSLSAGGDEQQYGGFVNVLYDFDLTPYGVPSLAPYVGVGVGYEQLQFQNARAYGTVAGNSTYIRNTGTDGNFATQAILGLAYNIASVPGLAFTVEYRFTTIPENLTSKGQVFYGSNPPTRGSIRTDGTFNHAGLFGFRYQLFQPEVPPPAPPVPVVAPAPEPARTYLVFFDWDRADLTARARQIIGEAAQASTRVQTTRIEVNGYTDLSGTAAYNQRLSVRRAQSVEAELIRDGVPRNEILIHGYGESNPLVPTAKGVREPQNRRVEIILH
ncbi:MAG TPA: OmpA family protein [Acetobacteraceae bacterium]|nr:OmpA family protein [Acetobacteraceae bacterium]